jgi:hypothetical protein
VQRYLLFLQHRVEDNKPGELAMAINSRIFATEIATTPTNPLSGKA